MTPSPPADLPRKLGTLDVALLVAGIVIGVGIFSTPGLVALDLSSPGWTIAAWVLGGVIALTGALALAELGTVFPRAGGDYVYLHRCFGPLPAFLYGWLFFTISGTGSIAALAVAAGQYAGELNCAIPPTAVSVVLVALLTVLNLAGLRAGATTQNVLTGAKLAALAAVIVLGFMAPGPGGSPAAEAAAREDGPLIPLRGLALALVPICFTYMGWNAAGYVGGEIREPRRHLPRGVLLGTAAVAALYVVINAAYLHALAPSEMRGDVLVASSACARVLGDRARVVVGAVVLVSILGGLNGMILAHGRVLYAMAREGHFLALFGRVHPRWGTPAAALTLQCVWAVGLVLTGTFERLVSYVTFVMVGMSCLVVAAVFVARRRAEPPFRAPTAAPVIYLAGAALVLVGVVRFAPIDALVGIGMTAAGLFVYASWSLIRPRTRGVTSR